MKSETGKETRTDSNWTVCMKVGNFKKLMEDKRLGRAAKRMLFTLQTLLRSDEETKPLTYKYVANLANIQVKPTKRLIKELVDARYIKTKMTGINGNAKIIFIQSIDWFDIEKYENYDNGDGITVSISVLDHDRLHQSKIRASASDFFVYVALSRWGKEESYPNLKSISNLVDVSISRISVVIERLEEIGMLQVDRSKQYHNSNTYKRNNINRLYTNLDGTKTEIPGTKTGSVKPGTKTEIPGTKTSAEREAVEREAVEREAAKRKTIKEKQASNFGLLKTFLSKSLRENLDDDLGEIRRLLKSLAEEFGLEVVQSNSVDQVRKNLNGNCRTTQDVDVADQVEKNLNGNCRTTQDVDVAELLWEDVMIEDRPGDMSFLSVDSITRVRLFPQILESDKSLAVDTVVDNLKATHTGVAEQLNQYESSFAWWLDNKLDRLGMLKKINGVALEAIQSNEFFNPDKASEEDEVDYLEETSVAHLYKNTGGAVVMNCNGVSHFQDTSKEYYSDDLGEENQECEVKSTYKPKFIPRLEKYLAFFDEDWFYKIPLQDRQIQVRAISQASNLVTLLKKMTPTEKQIFSLVSLHTPTVVHDALNRLYLHKNAIKSPIGLLKTIITNDSEPYVYSMDGCNLDYDSEDKGHRSFRRVEDDLRKVMERLNERFRFFTTISPSKYFDICDSIFRMVIYRRGLDIINYEPSDSNLMEFGQDAVEFRQSDPRIALTAPINQYCWLT